MKHLEHSVLPLTRPSRNWVQLSLLEHYPRRSGVEAWSSWVGRSAARGPLVLAHNCFNDRRSLFCFWPYARCRIQVALQREAVGRDTPQRDTTRWPPLRSMVCPGSYYGIPRHADLCGALFAVVPNTRASSLAISGVQFCRPHVTTHSFVRIL